MKGGDRLTLGDIEDYCLQFMQHNNKLFVFGEVHQSLRAFEFEVDDEEEIENQQEDIMAFVQKGLAQYQD